MPPLPPIHLCLMQPVGDVESLALLDPLRYWRWQLRRMGAQVSMARNRLRHEAVNFVFGAHLGFDPALIRRHTCLFVNLEPLEAGGATAPGYLELLASSAVIDCDPLNVGAYASDVQDVPIAPILHAPYLHWADSPALQERPIDLLCIGALNERQAAWVQRIESLGHPVALFDSPMFGEERDAFIRQSKAVLLVHPHEGARFEQALAAHCLSLGTPVISERGANTAPHPAFEDCVLWLQGPAELEQFFSEDFGSPAYFDVVTAAIERFSSADPIADFADVLGFAQGYARAHRQSLSDDPWQPRQLRLGAGTGYRPGWLNLDADAGSLPDAQLDLTRPLSLPAQLNSMSAGPCRLDADSLDTLEAWLPTPTGDGLPTLLANGLRLLREGGELHLDLPADTAANDPSGAPSAAPAPAGLLRHTGRFWLSGSTDHRLELQDSVWLDADGQPCARGTAAMQRSVLRKVPTTPAERVDALARQIDLSLPDDDAPLIEGLDAALATLSPPPSAPSLAPSLAPSMAPSLARASAPPAVQPSTRPAVQPLTPVALQPASAPAVRLVIPAPAAVAPPAPATSAQPAPAQPTPALPTPALPSQAGWLRVSSGRLA